MDPARRSGSQRAGDRSPGVAGRVTSQSYFGHDALVRVAVPGMPEPVAARVAGSRRLSTGASVIVSVPEPVVPFPREH